MSRWSITPKLTSSGRKVVVVTMNSNKVNSMGPEMLQDFHKAIDVIETNHKLAPIIFTAEGSTFSAGLDLKYLFGVSSKEESEKRLRNCLGLLGTGVLRLLTLPNLTVAAINGHALAGGAVFANACDFRVGVKNSTSQFGAIEVKVGVPFPSWAHIATAQATPISQKKEATLLGRVYTANEALSLGIYNGLSESKETLIEKAMEIATSIPEGSYGAYAMVKEEMHLQHVNYVKERGEIVLEKTIKLIYSDDGWNQIQASVSGIGGKSKL